MKEDIGLTYAALGLVLVWEGRRRLGAGLAVAPPPGLSSPSTSCCPRSATPRERSSVRASPATGATRSSTSCASASSTRSRRRPCAHAGRRRGPRDARPDDGRPLSARAAGSSSPFRRPRSTFSRPTTCSTRSSTTTGSSRQRPVAVAGAVGAGRVRPAMHDLARAGARPRASVLAVLSLQWVGAISRQIHAEWPRRADRQAILDAIPPGRASRPRCTRSRTSPSASASRVPEPMIAVRVGVKGGVDRERVTAQLELRRSSTRTCGSGARRPSAKVEQRDRAPRVPQVMRRGDTVVPQGAGTLSPGRDRSHRRARRLGARAGEECSPARGSPAARVRDRDRPAVGVFDRIVVSTDSERIAQVARWYGADVPFLRPDEYATSTSPDIEWIAWTLPASRSLRPVRDRSRDEPVQGAGLIRRGLEQLLDARGRLDPGGRARQAAPGKMWVSTGGRLMRPLSTSRTSTSRGTRASTRRSPRCTSEQRARDRLARVVEATGTREGRMLAPFLTEGLEGLNIDDEDDFARAERLVASGRARLVGSRASRILARRDGRSQHSTESDDGKRSRGCGGVRRVST